MKMEPDEEETRLRRDEEEGDGIRRVERNNHGRRSFAIVGPKGAVEFWFEPGNLSISGVEYHARDGAGHWETEPSYPDCELLGGNCWHDGTSVWAHEHWVPGFNRGGEEWVWAELGRTFAKWSAEKP